MGDGGDKTGAVKPKQAKPKQDWSNLSTRFFSAIIIAVVFLIPLWFGGWLWGLFIAALGLRMGWEWTRMSQTDGTSGYGILAASVILAVLLYLIMPGTPAAWAGLASAIIAPFFVPKVQKSWAVVGAVYIVVPVICMMWLRGFGAGIENLGFQRVIFVTLVVIAADVGAYFAGKSIGGPKLAPSLSPKKTWAGFGGGLVFGGLVAGMLAELISDNFYHGVMIGLTLVVAAVFGDFLESGFKRHFGVKDTGTLLPGHGGVLDRADSHMAAFTKASLILAFAAGAYPF